MTRLNDKHDRRENFIQAVADYMIRDSAMKSICLEMEKPDAQSWARMRQAINLHGWERDVEVAKQLIRELFTDEPTK